MTEKCSICDTPTPTFFSEKPMAWASEGKTAAEGCVCGKPHARGSAAA